LDAEATLDQLGLDPVAELGRLEPHGQGNPPVQILLRNLRHHRPPRWMGKEEQHLRLTVTDGRNTAIAVRWNVKGIELPADGFDLAAMPQINDYNGSRTVQLKVLDWR
jgi:single-stranded-DNA-specific exonuclease